MPGGGTRLLQAFHCLDNAPDHQRDVLRSRVRGGVRVAAGANMTHALGHLLRLVLQRGLVQRGLQVELLQDLGHQRADFPARPQLVPRPLQVRLAAECEPRRLQGTRLL